MDRDSKTETVYAELFAQLAAPFTGEELFDCLTDLTFFIKNLRGEYVVVNRELVSRCGRRDKGELIGRRADEVFPPPLGQGYLAQDETLLKTGGPILNQLELHVYHSGRIGWCLTNKLPLRGRQDQVVGLVGISKDLQAPNERGADYSPLAAVVQHIQAHFGEPLRIADLARRAGLSPYQLDQRIRRVFQITTGQFLLKTRMDAAVRRLRATQDAVALIALDCGYSDQSAFTRQFRQTVGLTPSEFRKTCRSSPLVSPKPSGSHAISAAPRRRSRPGAD
jgi:AraC-like DNA-binding protein